MFVNKTSLNHISFKLSALILLHLISRSLTWLSVMSKQLSFNVSSVLPLLQILFLIFRVIRKPSIVRCCKKQQEKSNSSKISILSITGQVRVDPDRSKILYWDCMLELKLPRMVQLEILRAMHPLPKIISKSSVFMIFFSRYTVA